MNVSSTVLCAVLFVLCAPELSLAQQSDCDKQCVSEVRGMLKASYGGFSVSWLEKANELLGDRVGVAILKIYQGKALFKPDNIRTFLPVIREAFKYPQLIEGAANKKAIVTLRLLHKLQRRIRDHFLHQEITGTLNFLNFSSAKTDSSGAEKPR